MYWPNEPARLYPNGRQEGGRDAFSAMLAEGTIRALDVYSFLVERAKFADAADFEAAAFEKIRNFSPDILFVQHVSGADISARLWHRVRTELPATTFVYHEGDVYGRLTKRLDAATIDALRNAHLVLACGLGSIVRLYRKYTDAPIEHMPHCFQRSLFAKNDPAKAIKSDQIAMIASCGRLRRLPMFYMPGGRRRAKFARRLSEEFGKKFALYGHGWAGLASWRGSLPFLEQESAIQSAQISANWDHFDSIASYFSDRLPISLVAGVPHVTSWHEGYDEMFADCPGLYACKSIYEAVETCRHLLARPAAQLLEEGLAAREWAIANLEAKIVFKRAVGQAVRLHRRGVTS